MSSSGAYQSDMFFWDSSTAADATITASNSVVNFLGTSTAANAHITVSADSFFSLTEQAHGGNAVVTCIGGNQYAGSSIYFQEYATAEGGTYTAIGGSTSGEFGSFIDFTDSATADNATFVVNGGMGAGLAGASLTFDDTTTAAQANITANGGVGGSEGGAIFFDKKSKGSNAGVTLNGNGELDISHHRGSGISIGSLTGEGSVFLGDNTLTIGGNNRSTAFSGIIQGTGGVAKSGTGTLTVSGANIYTGPTTVKGGVFVANNKQGSATGTGSVNVQTGTLAGKGAVSGPVTIGTGSGSGAFLAPSVAAPQPVTLSLASTLTLQADGTYTCKLNTSKARSDEVVANGVTIATGAHFGLQPMTNKKLAAGTVFTIVSNTASTPISGTFANLADGAVLTVGNTKLQASYEGGDGNDLALTVVP
ncbi:MAG TPA: autotransporter-associated beta strand repeat-containing protein [Chthoniobacterales bacterium]